MPADDGFEPTEAVRSEAAFDAARPAVDRIIAERFGPDAAVRAHRFVHQPERPIVAVLDLTGATVPTAVVKFAPREPDGVIDDHSEAGWQLANEWATLAFLTMVARERDGAAPELPVPECYGGDRDAALVVMADLGDGDSMAEVLLRDPAVAGAEATDAAVRAFEGYVDAIAAIHLATFGAGDRYREFRAEFGPPPNDPLAPSTLLGGWRELGVHLELPLDTTVENEVASVEARLERPGTWEVLSLKDLCPDNNRVLPGGEVRLFDAQYSGLHHGLVDIAYLHTTMPTCWCVRRLPDGLADRLVERYLDRLRAGGHDPGDRTAFARELAACRVYMALWRGGGAARHAPSEDGDARPYWDAYEFSMVSHRQQLAFRTRQLVDAAALRPDLAALHAWAQRLQEVVVRTWPSAEPLPLYPAFG